ncbi:MAG TPA: serine/threonine-protein kinase [Terriglobales bacterium]|nr:serine/threonine-protein kinase [Terriglobales bacterium]
MPQGLSLDADRLRRFEQEALATAALNHPNILAAFDFGTSEGSPYVVSELLEGETLRERLRRGSIAARKAVDYALQIAHGLAAAHEKGVIHRDLKPENLFLTKDGRVKILDFGLAKLTQSEPGAHSFLPTATHGTEAGVVLGTAGYMSPEQVRGLALDAPLRHIQFQSHSLRDAVRQTCISRRHSRGYDELDPEGRSSRLERNQSQCFSGPGAHGATLPGKEP